MVVGFEFIQMPRPTWVFADQAHAFMNTVYLLKAHLWLFSWRWQWVHCTQMFSRVTRSQSRRASLGCGEMGDFHEMHLALEFHQIMDVQLENLQQLRHDVMSIWTKIAKECFQHLEESLPRIITAVLKVKEGPTWYKTKLYRRKWPVFVSLSIHMWALQEMCIFNISAFFNYVITGEHVLNVVGAEVGLAKVASGQVLKLSATLSCRKTEKKKEKHFLRRNPSSLLQKQCKH